MRNAASDSSSSLLAFAAGLSPAQDRLKTYPGYEQYRR